MKKRVCNGICKEFQVNKPPGMGRYASGQVRCQICDIWIDCKGCHLKDNSPATPDSEGWRCNCCNYRVRTRPRNLKYKTKLRLSSTPDSSKKAENDPNLSYFNKQRASMIKKLSEYLLENSNQINIDDLKNKFQKDSITIRDIEYDFDESIERIIDLAYVLDPPNKISMIVEFDRVKLLLNKVPTKSNMEKLSQIHPSQYDEEFQSWEHFLNILGHDPWHRESTVQSSENVVHSETESFEDITIENESYNVNVLKEELQNKIKNDPKLLSLWNTIIKNMDKIERSNLEKILLELE